MDLLSQFAFPPEAKADFIAKGLVGTNLGQGVTEYKLGGFDKGLGYRFYIEPVLNKIKTEEAGIDMFDDIELVEWFKDRKNKPTERITMLPDGLLKLRRKRDTVTGKMEIIKDENGQYEVMGGLYADAYKRFKEGRTSPGLSLSRWGSLSLSHVATLNSEGVHTVEQFAAMPRDRVEGRFPKGIVEAFDKAIRYVTRENSLEDIKHQVEDVVLLKQSNSKLNDEVKTLREMIESMEVPKTTKKKGK